MEDKETKTVINRLKGTNFNVETYADASFNKIGYGYSQKGYAMCLIAEKNKQYI